MELPVTPPPRIARYVNNELNTPFKFPCSQPHTTATEDPKYKTRVGDVENALCDELVHSVFVDTPGFLEHIFPIDDTLVDAIFEQCTSTETPMYSNGSWTGLSQQPEKEKDLYDPFTKVANYITAHCAVNAEFPHTQRVQWCSHPDKAPILNDMAAADMKPDIVANIGTPIKGGDATHWRSLHVAMEVKKASTTSGPALLQLLKYLRQLFHECHDRRFAVGLVLARSNVSVYLADRSGVLGSETFDIHTAPEKLIRVIAGIQTLPPQELGWDPTMKLVDRAKYEAAARDGQTLPTPMWSFLVPGHTHRTHFWTVDMPKPKGNGSFEMEPDKWETFLLEKPISLFRGEAILGRATRIWKAWKAADMGLPQAQRQVYILKDTWRDQRRKLEGDYYKEIGECEHVASMYSYGIVQIDGIEDSTLDFVRRGLQHSGSPRLIDAAQVFVEPAPKSPGTDSRKITSLTLYTTDFLPKEQDSNGRPYSPKSRIHSRLVMSTYGWPIRFFNSCGELVTVMRDAIAGHKESFRKGVLHRDISTGNILIVRKSDGSIGGALIDFDNAVKEGHETLADDPLSFTLPFASSEILSRKRLFKSGSPPNPVNLLGKRARTSVPPPPLPPPPKHDAVHDLEGFFWVLVYLSISRSGPGGIRRPALLRVDQNEEQIRSDFADHFEESVKVIRTTKANTFLKDDIDELIRCISGFCEPLGGLISEFYRILREAYKTYDLDELHDKVLEIFNEVEGVLRQDPPKLTRDMQKQLEDEAKRRNNDLPGHWDHLSPKVNRVANTSKQPVTPAACDNSNLQRRYAPQDEDGLTEHEMANYCLDTRAVKRARDHSPEA